MMPLFWKTLDNTKEILTLQATLKRGQIILQAPVAPPSSLLWASVSSPDIRVGIRLTHTAINIAAAHKAFLSVGRLRNTRNL